MSLWPYGIYLVSLGHLTFAKKKKKKIYIYIYIGDSVDSATYANRSEDWMSAKKWDTTQYMIRLTFCKFYRSAKSH